VLDGLTLVAESLHEYPGLRVELGWLHLAQKLVVGEDGTVGVVQLTWLENEALNGLDDLDNLGNVGHGAANVSSSAEEWWDDVVELQELNEVEEFSGVEGGLELEVENLQIEWLALDDEGVS